MSIKQVLDEGDVISNKDLMDIFRCGNMGGMRRSKETGTLVLIADHTKGIYEDRWVGDELHYTGMGKEGDQDLHSTQNRTLLESSETDIEVHLFEVYERGKYIYIGEIMLSSEPYQSIQLDVGNNERYVWIFPIKLKSADEPISLPLTIIRKKEEQKEKIVRVLSNEELKLKIKHTKTEPGIRKTTTQVYQRDPYISEYVKRLAGGICQLCEEKAPFIDKKKEPFLELHHIEWLSKGGEDSLTNTVALCPNCHRKMHILDLEQDKKKLRGKISI